MKKIISLVVAAAMLLSVFSVSAFAAEGQPTPTVGPAPDSTLYGGARVGIFNTSSHNTSYVMTYNYRESKLEVDNDAIPGMTYDLASNTCTIKDVHQPDNQLFVWYMGNDFKLKVEGECEFGIIYVYNYFNFHGTSLNIIGNGTLTVNRKLINEEAIHMFCEGDNAIMQLDIADSVTVHLYSQENEEPGEDEEKYYPAVALSQTAITPAQGGAITVGGKTAPEVKHQQLTDEISDTVKVVSKEDLDEEVDHGLRVTRKDDPDGTYVMGIMDDTVYMVMRYIYIDDLAMWMVDSSFAANSTYYGRRYTKEQFEAEYDYVYGMAPTPIRFADQWQEENRGSGAVKLMKDGEPDAVYAGEGYWSDYSYEGDPDGYTVSRVVWNDTEEIYVKDPSFRSVDIPFSELEQNGYTAATETNNEQLELTVWSGPSTDGNRWKTTREVLKRSSEPDALFVQIGTYSGSDGETGITMYRVHFDPETEEHYIMYGTYSAPEYVSESDEALENGTGDFYYAVEDVTRQVEIRFVREEYEFDMYGYNGVEVKNDSAPGETYAYDTVHHYIGNGKYEILHNLYRLVKNEKKNRWFEDTEFDSIEFRELSEIELMGYSVVESTQPLSFSTKGRVSLSEYPIYTDNSGKKYYVNYNDEVYSYSEDDTVTLSDGKYYFGTLMPELTPADLNSTSREVLTDNYSYWISGPEYHHVGAEQSEPQAYALWVNGEQVTSDHLTISCGKGTATFNPSNHTLTLNNAEITKGTDTDWTYTGILSHLPAISVVVMGDCTITETGGDGIGTYNNESYQIGDVIYPAPYDMTVCGDGTLTIKESTPMYGYGLYCTGNLTIDGITLKIDSAAAGIWASDLKMSDTKADIHTSSWYSGIVVNRGDFDFDNCTVTAESAEGSGLLLGSDMDFSTLTVNSGTLTLKGEIGVQGEVDKSIVTVNGGKLAIDSTNGAFNEAFLADNAKNIVMGEGIGVTSGEINGKAVVIEKLSASGGFTLSGKLTTFLGDKDYVNIRLLSEENWEINSLFDGDATEYEIGNVPAGTYTMTVSKKNHVTRTYQLTVSGDTTQDAKLHPIGDINGDGKVTTMDFGRANAHARGAAALTGYEFDCANVIPDAGTAKVTTMDAGRINAHAKGTSSLWAA